MRLKRFTWRRYLRGVSDKRKQVQAGHPLTTCCLVFTHFGKDVPYSKNWLFKSEALWYERWEQILELSASSSNLQYVEIVTWNDYGESHHIAPYTPDHNDDGSSLWAKDLPHEAFLDFAKPYMTAFKQGLSRPVIEQDMLVYWYRPHLKSVSTCDATDTVGQRPEGWDLVQDTVFVAALTRNGGTVTVTSGRQGKVEHQVGPGVTMIEVPMGVGQQKFTLKTDSVELQATSSQDVLDTCWVSTAPFGFVRPKD